MNIEEKNEDIKFHIIELTKEIDTLVTNSDIFLKEIVSFLKWTTAFSFVIIAWFTTQLNPHSTIAYWLGIFGLIFICASFCVSIYTLYEILHYLELTWRAIMPLSQAKIFLSGDLEKNPLKKNIPEIIKDLLDSSSLFAKERNDWVENFPIKRWVTIHLVLLLLGLLSYSSAILIK